MKEISMVVLDMDGTLYQIDGNPAGYSGSTLESSVLQNARTFIKSRENCSEQEVEFLLQQGLSDSIGLSNFLSQRYNISRDEYFRITWDISPSEIVQNFITAVEVVKRLKAEGKYLILLTSAPEIWEQIVIGFIGLSSFFDEIYTGEKFGSKKEIFKLLASRFDPETILSVGDQLKTDIEPARVLGMKTLQVSSPEDVSGVLIGACDEE